MAEAVAHADTREREWLWNSQADACSRITAEKEIVTQPYIFQPGVENPDPELEKRQPASVGGPTRLKARHRQELNLERVVVSSDDPAESLQDQTQIGASPFIQFPRRSGGAKRARHPSDGM